MEKINLNFFGEQVTIVTPKDLASLRTKISEAYSLSSSDAAEIILFYTKDSKKSYIINGNDFEKYKESKIDTIFLDVNQNSKLYLDNVSQIKNEIKKEEESKEKKEEKKELDEKDKKEIEKLKAEKEAILKRQKEKYDLCEDKLAEIKRQKVELEKVESEVALECTLDMLELKEECDEIDKKIEEIQNKGEPKKEVVLKSTAKIKYPYSQEDFKLNFKNPKSLFKALNALKEKRMKERKALEEKKLLESKNEEMLKNLKTNMPDAVPIFKKVNYVLNKTVQKVKLLAKEKAMTQEEKEIAKKEEEMNKEKEKRKKEQIEKIQKITRDAVNEINDLTKLVIQQSNSLIERINNPQLYKSQSSDDILLRAVPKVEKKEKPEIHYHVMCDGCKVTPLRGNRYKCKQCKDFDFCEDCYKKNKESHGHDFRVIAHPACRNRLGHPNKKYCQRGTVHSKIMCDGCGMLPIAGWRYKCSICDDYNLCENCEERIGGKHNHPFIKLTYSLMLNKFNENYLKLNTYEPNK